MKWCRFQVGPHISHGIVEDDRVIEVSGNPLAEHTVTRTSHPLGQVKLLPPVIPAVEARMVKAARQLREALREFTDGSRRPLRRG